MWFPLRGGDRIRIIEVGGGISDPLQYNKTIGEIGSQCSWTLISSYLTVFYTDVVGLTPVVISAIMLIARIWDAIRPDVWRNRREYPYEMRAFPSLCPVGRSDLGIV